MADNSNLDVLFYFFVFAIFVYLTSTYLPEYAQSLFVCGIILMVVIAISSRILNYRARKRYEEQAEINRKFMDERYKTATKIIEYLEKP